MIGVGAVRTVQQGLPTATPNTAFRSVSCSRPADGDHRMSARPRIMWRGLIGIAGRWVAGCVLLLLSGFTAAVGMVLST